MAIKNDENLKNSKDLEKFLESIDIIRKDLISIFERNRIKKIETIIKTLSFNNINLKKAKSAIILGSIEKDIRPV